MKKMWLFVCLFAVLGSQGIVVKCTATIFFRTVDSRLRCHQEQQQGPKLTFLCERQVATEIFFSVARWKILVAKKCP